MESMPKEIEITKFRVLIVGSSFGFDPLRLARRVQNDVVSSTATRRNVVSFLPGFGSNCPRFIFQAHLPSTFLEGASAGESYYAVVWQTWLCHHFIPIQFPSLRAYHLDNPGSRSIKEIRRPYAHAPDFGCWLADRAFIFIRL